ncbi:hypothetical protein quinque_002331 [Culex quinquefasciatus]
MDVPWAGLAERQHRRITGVRRGSLNRPSFRIIFITICDGSLVPIKYAFRTPYQVRILESTTLKLAKSTPSVLEVQIFRAVYDRCKCNADGRNVDNVVSKVRFSLKTVEQLLSVVRLSGILDWDHLLDAITE